MSVSTVAGVDDYRSSNIGSICSSAFNRMAHNDSIASHGLYSQNSVAEAFALNYTGVASCNVYNICAQIFTSQLEGSTSTSAGLIEQVDNGFTTQRGHLFNIPLHNLFHFLSCFQNQFDFFNAKAFQIQYISAAERYICFSH
ncbi:hypothetical protein EVA_14314 [gut metagenome]|uniref:Uncharacterized protein n=1 Tax=gut metagenome TaxID=749906 RepID=J9FSW7_9ZZZZ